MMMMQDWLDEENASHFRLLQAVEMEHRISIIGFTDVYQDEYQVEVWMKDVNGEESITNVDTYEEAHKLVVESFPEVDWETTGW